jgi:hypothetical protein
MTRRYAHLSPTTLQQAVTTLQDLQGGNKTGTRTGVGTTVGM